MQLPSRQFPDQPAVDSAKGQLAFVRTGPCARYFIQYPLEFGSRKIGINHEPRPFSDQWRKPPGFQLVAIAGGSPVLPYDGRMDRLATRPVPADNGLPLVGNAN